MAGVGLSVERGPRPPSILGRVLRVALLAATAIWTPGLAAASCTSHVADDRVLTRRGELGYAWARAHLEAPFQGYGVLDDMGVGAFDAVLLSNLASGLMNVDTLDPSRRDELRPLAAELARRALSNEVAPHGVHHGASLGEHNLYASHLLLVLGVAHHLGVEDHDDVAASVARHLHERSLAGPDFHARSYPGSTRWPADQAATLAALRLHDHEHGTHLSERPIAGWLAWLGRHRTDGLPWSTTGALRYARVPRGCAMSWIATYLAQIDPDEGAHLYDAYRDRHGTSFLGWRGFREWPRGHDGGSDLDAGPVLFGTGTAATGIGLGAARLYGDSAQLAGIERTADSVGLGAPASARYLLAPTLGQAMLFSGETATFWFERPEPRERTDTDWPIGAALVLLAITALDVWLVRGLRR